MNGAATPRGRRGRRARLGAAGRPVARLRSAPARLEPMSLFMVAGHGRRARDGAAGRGCGARRARAPVVPVLPVRDQPPPEARVAYRAGAGVDDDDIPPLCRRQ